MIARKLALGTAQFGMAYGVTNTHGQMPHTTATLLLQAARAAGMDTLDTAVAYGESEQALGRCGVAGWRVISKLPPLPPDVTDARPWVVQQLRASLARLGQDRLEALLLHRPAQLLGPQGAKLLEGLLQLQAQGVVGKIGVSVYHPDELPPLMALHRFDIVQAPSNLLDRRLIDSGWVHRLHALGVELHTRSAFLQGLLLSPRVQRQRFAAWAPVWRAWDDWLTAQGLTALEACLRYALHQPHVERVVLGFESADQLRQALACASEPLPDLPVWPAFDARLLDPSIWNTA